MTCKKQKEDQPQSASGSAQGQASRPVDRPAPAAKEAKEAQPKTIPIGYPMPPDVFRRLKAEAEQAAHEAERTAQEDEGEEP
jgi:hypothetical protein